jgi:CPA1 family monovalent cation:H+ antiporter
MLVASTPECPDSYASTGRGARPRISVGPRLRNAARRRGLRGALTITLALALPPSLAERQLLIAMAFGVVMFTLLVQGVTLSVVVQRAGLARSL